MIIIKYFLIMNLIKATNNSLRVDMPSNKLKQTYFILIICINEILTGTTTLRQGGTGSNDHEGTFHTPQSSGIGASPTDAV